MKTTRWLVLCAVLAVLAVSMVMAGQSRPAVSAEELRSIRNDTAKPHAVNMWVVTEDFTGPVTKAGDYLTELTKEVGNQKLGQQLGSAKPTALLILHEDPASKPQIRMTVALSAPKALKLKAPLKMMRLQFSRAVEHVHTGPYSGLGHVYSAIGAEVKRRSAAESAEFPVALELISDPRSTQPNAIQTRMLVPLKGGPKAPGAAPREGLVPT